MRRFSLSDGDRCRRAIDFFTEGKQADFPLDGGARANCARLRARPRRPARLFVQIQLEASLLGGGLEPAGARQCSRGSAARWAFRRREFAALEAMLRMRALRPRAGGQQPSPRRAGPARGCLPGRSACATDASDARGQARLPAADEPEPPRQAGGATACPSRCSRRAHERTQQHSRGATRLVRASRGMK